MNDVWLIQTASQTGSSPHCHRCASITGKRHWRRALGECGGRVLLDWQLQQWGLSGHAAPLPFTARAGGHTKSSPGPWQPQVAFVARHHGFCSTELPPAHYQSQTPSGSSVCVCSFVYVFTAEYTCMSSYATAHCVEKKSAPPNQPGKVPYVRWYRKMCWLKNPWNKHNVHLDQGHWGV